MIINNLWIELSSKICQALLKQRGRNFPYLEGPYLFLLKSMAFKLRQGCIWTICIVTITFVSLAGISKVENLLGCYVCIPP